MRILLAEDEKDLNNIISKKLTKDGYSVDSVFDGEEAIDILSYTDYDAIILDIMMPRKDGFDVLRYLRESGKNTPVLFLTAKDAVTDKVKGLDAGANDYLVKPFSFDELTARLRAMTRLSFGISNSTLTVSDLVLDTATKVVTRGGKPIELSAKEYALLEYLMHNQGVILSREQIEDHIWSFDYEGGTNVVDVYISYLRKKIDGDSEEKLIRTVRGRGYVIRSESIAE